MIRQIYDRIVKIFHSDTFSAELKRNITAVLYNEFPDENEVFKLIGKDEKTATRWMEKRERSGNQWDSGLFQVQILPVSNEVIVEAEKFIYYAFKYKFASLDAVIAGTAIAYDKDHFIIVTHDSSFRRALLDEGIHIMKEKESAAI